jgi:hypothetical protein
MRHALLRSLSVVLFNDKIFCLHCEFDSRNIDGVRLTDASPLESCTEV